MRSTIALQAALIAASVLTTAAAQPVPAVGDAYV